MVETQLCELRGISDTFVGRAYSVFHFLLCSVCELNVRYGCYYSTKFHTFYGRSFARVLYYIFYPHERYRLVTPLDAARVNRTIFHNHSVH